MSQGCTREKAIIIIGHAKGKQKFNLVRYCAINNFEVQCQMKKKPLIFLILLTDILENCTCIFIILVAWEMRKNRNGCVFNRESPCVRTVLRVCFNTARFLLVMFLISTWRVLCKFVMV
jgi:hypothetical protein